MAKAEKEKAAKFFGAIAKNSEVKVGETREEVEEYFRNRFLKCKKIDLHNIQFPCQDKMADWNF